MSCSNVPAASAAGARLLPRARAATAGVHSHAQHALNAARQTIGRPHCKAGREMAPCCLHSRHPGQQQNILPDSSAARSLRPDTAAATAGSNMEVGSAWTGSSADSISRELASRLSAPLAVQHSSDGEVKQAALQKPADVLPAAAVPVDSIGNGSGAIAAPASDAGASHVSPERQQGGRGGSSRGPQFSDQHGTDRLEHPPESGLMPDAPVSSEALPSSRMRLFLPAEQSQIRESWRKIMRWSKVRAESSW